MKNNKEKPTDGITNEIDDGNVIYAQPIRIISLRKSPGQPLVC